MASLALSVRLPVHDKGSRPTPSPNPVVMILNVRNPGKRPKAFIVSPPNTWGPYATCEELQAAYDDLRQQGEI